MKTTLKRFFILATMLAILLNFVGCSSYKFDEEKVGADMEEKLTQLFISVQNGDKETFKTFFADPVISRSDFEEGFQYVCNQYQGEILSVKCHYPMGEGRQIGPEELSYYTAFGSYEVITSKNHYKVYVEFYTHYPTKYPDGSYKIKVFKLLSQEQRDNGETFNDCPGKNGIYYPGWQNDDVK